MPESLIFQKESKRRKTFESNRIVPIKVIKNFSIHLSRFRNRLILHNSIFLAPFLIFFLTFVMFTKKLNWGIYDQL